MLFHKQLLDGLGIVGGSKIAESLPFAPDDVTAGVENELQAAVIGDRNKVDLPLTIENSNYFANLLKRHQRGEMAKSAITQLDTYLNDNPEGVWENSWVRIPQRTLSRETAAVLDRDLLCDKSLPSSEKRSDWKSFFCVHNAEECVRVPISYLLKLALIQAAGGAEAPHPLITDTAYRMIPSFINDNTSPEISSFHIISPTAGNLGGAVARETSRRFLLTQLLVLYAGHAFELTAGGQKPLVYFSPSPPERQKELNECISDSFYRELMMSPCLSGWDRGEEKNRYMHLCHQVLSRSQLNAVAKLREAGIITSNLVVLPNTSNISLANNGTHLSLGSRRLGQALSDPASGFSPAHEKYLGDLVVKFVEHFLPLFVGVYSAAPYRLGFKDFHPESVLGFLPHELDFTHLRMLWRRWKKKANLKFLGIRWTPFGPPAIDRLFASLGRLRGDFIPDFRLIDYLGSLLSTDQTPALDGSPGNCERLKKDLQDLGIFDNRMSLYLLYRQRLFSVMGFSGFEGRHHSLFGSLAADLSPAVDLQWLITALAYKLIVQGRLTHAHIPDDPSTESERRQVVFDAAIDLPTFYIRTNTGNRLLSRIADRTPNIRLSRRYPGYRRIYIREYRRSLVNFLRSEAADLIDLFGMNDTISDLEWRLAEGRTDSALGRLTNGILDLLGAKNPMKVLPYEFNVAAEKYYRERLRLQFIREAFDFLESDFSPFTLQHSEYRSVIRSVLKDRDVTEFVRDMSEKIRREEASQAEIQDLIHLLILLTHRDIRDFENPLYETSHAVVHHA